MALMAGSKWETDPKWEALWPSLVFSQAVSHLSVLLRTVSFPELLTSVLLLTPSQLGVVKVPETEDPEAKARRLLRLIMKTPPGGYDKFCDLLRAIKCKGKDLLEFMKESYETFLLMKRCKVR